MCSNSDPFKADMNHLCSDNHLAMIAKDLTNWEIVAVLGLSEAEVEEVNLTYRTLPLKRVKMLLRWKKKYKEDATYEGLVTAFSLLKRNDMADRVRQVLATPSCDSGISSPFAEHLKIWYTHNDPNDDVWPPIERGKFCKLDMVKIEIEISNASLPVKVLTKKVPIQLENIFDEDHSENETNGKTVILIEGAPGSGKSTLLCHLSEKWASGELFQQFSLVIYIKLREYSTTKSLCSVADILPCSSDMKESAWEEIKTANGKGVLFLLDGWDELPQSMQTNSIFKDIIKSSPEYPLLLSTVVVTSRYITSDDLLFLSTSHLEILGFTDNEIKECILDTTNNNEEATHALMAALESRPSLLGSCHLPLNVIIISFVFQVRNGHIPSTLLEVFKLLIIHCIQRHIRNKEPDKDHDDIISLENLPQELHTSFNSLCELAFNGLMNHKMVFANDELGSILDHLSLLRGVKMHEESKTGTTYSFFHHTVQELLAAMHLSKLHSEFQLYLFFHLFGQPKLDTMFQFYAGITSLQLADFRGILYHIIFRNLRVEPNNDTLLMMSAACNPGLRKMMYNHLPTDIENDEELEILKSIVQPGDNEIKEKLRSNETELEKTIQMICKKLTMENNTISQMIFKVSASLIMTLLTCNLLCLCCRDL